MISCMVYDIIDFYNDMILTNGKGRVIITSNMFFVPIYAYINLGIVNGKGGPLLI